jgi:hypothetical protein
MGDPIENPDVHWITREGVHIPIPNTPLSPAARGAMAPRMSKETMRAALQTQKEVAKMLGGVVIPDNRAFDVKVGNNWIEVKTNIAAKNDRVNMQAPSRQKKEEWVGFNKWTLAVDKRALGSTGQVAYYLFPGVGAFRYGNLIPTPASVLIDLFRKK